MKKYLLGLTILGGLGVGMLMPTSIMAFENPAGLCWSAEVSGGPSDGYYRCIPSGGCEWVSDRKKWLDSSSCTIPQ